MISKKILLTIGLLVCCFSLSYAQDDRIAQDIFANLRKTDKPVVVAVHFGTSNPETRAKTIEMFNIRIRKEFPDCDFREAWTSKQIIRKLATYGETIKTPSEVFAELERQGYTHVLVQSSNIINGSEMECLRRDVDAVKNKFLQIRIGEPLLSDKSDYEKSVLAIAAAYGDEKKANVLVCHGSMANYNPSYTMLDYVLRDNGYDNWYVGTIEGYPAFDSVVKFMKKNKEKKVNLIPCLFVAGEHVKKDISVEWKENLQKEGFKVSVSAHGLGEIDGILDIFMRHAKDAQKYRKLTAQEMKFRNSIR